MCIHISFTLRAGFLVFMLRYCAALSQNFCPHTEKLPAYTPTCSASILTRVFALRYNFSSQIFTAHAKQKSQPIWCQI